MKKGRLTASLMALALAAAMPGGMGSMATVNAEEAYQASAVASGTENGTEKVQLDTPTNLRWGQLDSTYVYPNGKYYTKWEGVNPSISEGVALYVGSDWVVEGYRDEQLVYSTTLYDPYYESYWDSDAQKTDYTDVPRKEHGLGMMCEKICESGSYKFRIKAVAMYDDEFYRNSEWSQWSVCMEYVRPERELGVVTGVTWDEEKAGVCHFTPLKDSQYLDYYTVYLYRQQEDESWDSWWTWKRIYAYECKDATLADVDFSDYVSRYGEGKYYVIVQACSNDIDVVAHGRESAASDILDTTVNAEKLSGILTAAADKSAVETTELLTNSADISAIQQAMQTDDAFREQVQGLESRYAQEQGIEVKPPAVSETAREYVNPGQVSVVGAAFNAAQGQTVNLQMDVTPEEERVPVYSGYKKNVQLDIRLVSENAEVHALNVPVSVTMPIPQGINAAQLVLLHRRSDGVTEPTAFHVNDDGTITFTVTSFSTFVFAEEGSGDEPSQPEPSQPEPSEPAPNPGQCGNGSVSDWLGSLSSQVAAAAPGSTVKVTKDQNINTLSNDIMQMLVKRGDVALEMEYAYQGTDYHIFIPAGKAMENDIPWYGPLYLAAHFSAADTAVDNAATYVVQKGDTLGKIARSHHTTVARLAAVNPQIRNINRIVTGQVINIE